MTPSFARPAKPAPPPPPPRIDLALPFAVFIQGEPMGQPRALCKAIPVGKGRWRAMVYEPDHRKIDHKDPEQKRWARANVWKDTIQRAIETTLPRVPFDLAMRVDLEAVGPRPEDHYGTGKNVNLLKPSAPYFWVTKPDRDNIDKIILDTLTELKLWVGDQLVCDGRIIKRYQKGRHEPCGVHVRFSAAIAGATILEETVQGPPQAALFAPTEAA